MSYIGFDTEDIQKGADSRYILQGVEDIIFEMCEYDYENAKLNIRNGFTLEDFVNGIAIGLIGETHKWESLRRKDKEEKNEQ
jgi:hypothetical protein